jgi:hypothetical protein
MPSKCELAHNQGHSFQNGAGPRCTRSHNKHCKCDACVDPSRYGTAVLIEAKARGVGPALTPLGQMSGPLAQPDGFCYAAAAHLTVLLCFAHCCRAVGLAAAKDYAFGKRPQKGSAAMRLHIDRNHLDGNLIALVVITLIIAIAMVY